MEVFEKQTRAKLYLRSTQQLSFPSTVPTHTAEPEIKQTSTEVKVEIDSPYSEEEIDLSEGLEREKRIYWNKRIQEFAVDLHEKRGTKHENLWHN